jgi:hypothetical protein
MKRIVAIVLFSLITVAASTPSFANEKNAVHEPRVIKLTETQRDVLQKVQEQNLLRRQRQLKENFCLTCHYDRKGPGPLPSN